MNKTAIKPHERGVTVTNTVIGGTLLAVIFFILYFWAGTHYLTIERNRGEGFHDNDLYFQADSEFLTLKLISTRGYYKRALFHPFFPIMFNPFAQFLQNFIDNPYVIASLFCALFGAICVIGSIYFFHLLTVPWPRNLLYASLVGLSGSHLVFSTVPDTYIFSAAGLIALMIVVKKRAPLWVWALVSVYLVGVNVLNAAFVAVAFIYAKFVSPEDWFPRIKTLLQKSNRKYLFRYIQNVGLLAMALVFLQKVVLNFWLLGRPREPLKDVQYLFVPNSFSEAFSKLSNLVEHLFFFNILAPVAKVVQHERNVDLNLVSFRDTSILDYSPIGWPGLIIWCLVLGIAGWSIVHYKLYNSAIFKIAFISLLINGVAFYLYGDDIMLYSCEWTFFLILIVVLGIERVIKSSSNLQANLLMMLFLLLLLLNNFYFQLSLYRFFDFTS